MGKLTKEEEVLLSNYSSTNNARSSCIFYVNAAIMSVAPIFLFYGVFQMEVNDSFIVWILSSVVAFYAIKTACDNQKKLLKDKVMSKRGTAIDREINQKYGNDKKMSPKEKEDRALYRKAEVADSESTYLSILYTNSQFVLFLIPLAFFMFVNFNPLINNLASMGAAAGAVVFLSGGKK